MLGTMIPLCVVFKPFPRRASLPTKIVSWNVVKQLEPTFIIMLVGMFPTFMGLYYGFYFMTVYAVDVLGLYPETATSSWPCSSPISQVALYLAISPKELGP